MMKLGHPHRVVGKSDIVSERINIILRLTFFQEKEIHNGFILFIVLQMCSILHVCFFFISYSNVRL